MASLLIPFSITLLSVHVAAQQPQNGPNHLACYQDFWPVSRTVLNAVNTTSNGMTIEVCQAFCASQNYIYYGLEYQNQCYCGNQLPFVLSNLECDQSCFGNPAEACGGNNSLSTYFTGVFPSGTTDLTNAIPALEANLARAESAATGSQLNQLVAAQSLLNNVNTQTASVLTSAIAAANSALAGYQSAATTTLDTSAALSTLSMYASRISEAEATATGTKLSSLQAAGSSVANVLQASATSGARATGAVQAAVAALGIYQGAIPDSNSANNLAQLSTIQSEVNAALLTAQAGQSSTLANAQNVISSILNNVPTVTASATQVVDSGIAVGLAALASPTQSANNVAELMSISSELATAVGTATADRLSSIQNAQTVVGSVLNQATGTAMVTSAIPSAISVGLAALATTASTDAAGDSNLAALSSIQSRLMTVAMTATGDQGAAVSRAEQTASAVLASSDSAAAIGAIAVGLAALNALNGAANTVAPISTPVGNADALATLSMIDSSLLAAEATASGAQRASLVAAENTASAVLAGSRISAAPAAISQGLAALRGGNLVGSGTPVVNSDALATLSMVESQLIAAESTASGGRRGSILSAAATASAVLANAQVSAAPAAIAVGIAALAGSDGNLASLSAVDSQLLAAEATATGQRLSSVRSAEALASSVLGSGQSQAAAAAIVAGLAALGLASGSSNDQANVLASLSSIDSRLLAAESTATGARLASLRGAEMTASGVLAQSQVSAAPAAITAGLLALGVTDGSGDTSGAVLASLSSVDARLRAAESTASGARLASLRGAEMTASGVLAQSQVSAAPAAISAGLLALAVMDGSDSSDNSGAVLASLSSVDARLLAAESTASGARLASLRGAEMTASGVLAQSQVSAAPAAISAGLLALNAVDGGVQSSQGSGTGMRTSSTAGAAGASAGSRTGTGAGAATNTGTRVGGATATTAGGTGAASTSGTGGSTTSNAGLLSLSIMMMAIFIGAPLAIL
ncbi:Predicted protein [Taphrina deformans PYCC 5710]|uniref:WSC domain-containing protein n=1 Tax=Taphrina deformans (strain PYCC 5710 / ATCC 11124 / CBS 356.35 / IMI 108563 / JCM 9778 / NBRC 8474) TaxID=1097556 RepID=R4X767_TAPDE|nr:Predicted protein [Taphrina deformans PYCC 5710]|eukprot:CCG81142.1 Predicted protein [Taphrina deformans PYCC 5710]